MANHPMSRLLLSIHTTPSSPPTITTTAVPEYSDVVIIFICLLCALICAVGVLGMIQWTCLKRRLPSTRATRTNDVEAPTECFKKKVVESLPTLVYKSSTNTNQGKEECVICLSDFVDGEDIRVLPRCAHVFHVGCIDTWLIGSNSLCCPSCRQLLVVSGCQCHKCEFDASARPSLPPQIEVHYLP